MRKGANGEKSGGKKTGEKNGGKKERKQAELGVPHSKSKLSGPNQNCVVLKYFGLMCFS